VFWTLHRLPGMRSSMSHVQALPLEPLHQPCFVLSIFERGSHELFALGSL
jgi:hypothetical protein